MKIAVIGAGSWGTAIAQLLASNGHNVSLWARRTSVAHGINANHANPDYLTDAKLSENIVATTSYEDALAHAPSKLVRGVGRALSTVVDDQLPVIVCSKGVEGQTGMVPVQILEDEMGNSERLAALSGPNHAEEVVRNVPAGTVIASSNAETAAFFQEAFGNQMFRAYTSDDVLGVELCAASKNVMAIAVGVSYGLGFGDNTAAMLITRGMAEMSRLVTKAGGQPMTCMGLAGAGDLIATCMSQHSRNRRFGEALTKGCTLEQFERESHMVAEGAYACQTLKVLAERYHVEMPITDVVRGVVWEGLDLPQAAEQLFSRSLKPEFWGM